MKNLIYQPLDANKWDIKPDQDMDCADANSP